MELIRMSKEELRWALHLAGIRHDYVSELAIVNELRRRRGAPARLF